MKKKRQREEASKRPKHTSDEAAEEKAAKKRALILAARKIRNRQSAKSSRRKQKEHLQTVEVRVDKLERENAMLKKRLAELEAERASKPGGELAATNLYSVKELTELAAIYNTDRGEFNATVAEKKASLSEAEYRQWATALQGMVTDHVDLGDGPGVVVVKPVPKAVPVRAAGHIKVQDYENAAAAYGGLARNPLAHSLEGGSRLAFSREPVDLFALQAQGLWATVPEPVGADSFYEVGDDLDQELGGDISDADLFEKFGLGSE